MDKKTSQEKHYPKKNYPEKNFKSMFDPIFPNENFGTLILDTNLLVTLEDLYNGSVKNVTVNTRTNDPFKKPIKKNVTVNIERGMMPGQHITVDDSSIVIVVQDHDRFWLPNNYDNHLATRLIISLNEALCGFRKAIETLDSRILMIISEDKIIKPNDVICIKGEGMPGKNSTGNLLVYFDIIFPDKTIVATTQTEQISVFDKIIKL